MSESNVALAEPSVALPDHDEQGSGPDRRKLLLIVGGAALAVLLGLAAWFLFFSGSGSSANDGLVIVHKSAPAAAAPKAAAPVPAAKPINEAIGRDPFTPVVKPVTASSTTTAAAGASAAAGSTTSSSTSSGTSVTLQMVKVTPTSATLKVDGKSYTASVGQVFATNFKLYGLFDAQCAGVLYGDQSVPLCVGDVRTLTS
jgi:hypothetical protein